MNDSRIRFECDGHAGRCPHPGAVLSDYLSCMGVSVAKLAEHIGWALIPLERLIAGRECMTADLALRLEKADIGDTEMWINIQNRYDIRHAGARSDISNIKPIEW